MSPSHVIRCKDCGFTSVYVCDKPGWKCAKCGGERPEIQLPPPKKKPVVPMSKRV